MIYLYSFRLPSREREVDFLNTAPKNLRTCYTTKYPFGMFSERKMPDIEFSEITVFSGDNGCGKSTVLNVIADSLKLNRSAPYNRSDFFGDYTGLCEYTLESEPSRDSRIITSDDVFDKVLDIRRLNSGIDDRRSDMISEWVAQRGNDEPNHLSGLDDYDSWKRTAEMRRRNNTQSQFLRSNLRRNVQERSNGESALSSFVDSIRDGGLYLLDEPENSLSPSNQLLLKYFIEDSARNHGCQFIISTHSPFLLSLQHALIYDLGGEMVRTCRWTELECVRVYSDFFRDNARAFDSE